jgi:TrmH family RNA methyltransferase
LGEVLITSSVNKKVAAIRRLRGRREREATGLFLAEGIRIVVEAAQLGVGIKTLVVAPELLHSDLALAVVAGRRAAGTPCLEVSAEVFGSLSAKEGPQGLAAVVHQRWVDLGRTVGDAAPATPPDDGPAAPPLWVALDSVQDPGNLGTIIRTSDAAGGAGVILIGDSTDPYDPTSVRASMGSLFAQRLARTGFEELLVWSRRQGYALVGTSGTAELAYDSPAPALAGVYGGPLILLLGSERRGLSPEQLSACDLVVKIPMAGRCDSLNLAVAAGIVLYEIRGRRDPRV